MKFKEAFLDAVSYTTYLSLSVLCILVIIAGVVVFIGSPIMLILTASSTVVWILAWYWYIPLCILGYLVIILGMTFLNYLS